MRGAVRSHRAEKGRQGPESRPGAGPPALHGEELRKALRVESHTYESHPWESRGPQERHGLASRANH